MAYQILAKINGDEFSIILSNIFFYVKAFIEKVKKKLFVFYQIFYLVMSLILAGNVKH